jgi:hypothetical protein
VEEEGPSATSNKTAVSIRIDPGQLLHEGGVPIGE